MLLPIERAVIFDYDRALIGHDSDFQTYYFRARPAAEKERLALVLIKHVIETYLRWTPQMVRDNLNMQVLKEWRLDKMVGKISFPKDLDRDLDWFYIASKIYPDVIRMNAQDVYLQVYRRILFPIPGHKAKFPKGYFSGKNGANKACACLKYAIENFNHFSSVDDMYDYFGNAKRCAGFLRKYKLMSASKALFDSHVEFLDYTLHPSQKDPFLYQYYHLWERVDEETRVKNRKPKTPSKSKAKTKSKSKSKAKGKGKSAKKSSAKQPSA